MSPYRVPSSTTEEFLPWWKWLLKLFEPRCEKCGKRKSEHPFCVYCRGILMHQHCGHEMHQPPREDDSP